LDKLQQRHCINVKVNTAVIATIHATNSPKIEGFEGAEQLWTVQLQMRPDLP